MPKHRFQYRSHALACAIVLFCINPIAQACTLWGASGSASAEGTLLVKNRDWKPDHQQSLRLVQDKKGMPYLGLYADEGSAPGLKAGVNPAGLSAVTASASSLPRALRHENTEHHSVLATVLRNYSTLDEVAAHAEQIFGQANPMFVLLADSTGLMQVEIGLHGKYEIKRSQNASLAHTNHYLNPALLDQTQKIGPSSEARFNRIQALLKNNTTPYTLSKFGEMSQDRHDGADNSLWRSGAEYTLASWQIVLPAKASPRLHFVLANPGKETQVSDWLLDAKFWRQTPRILAGSGT